MTQQHADFAVAELGDRTVAAPPRDTGSLLGLLDKYGVEEVYGLRFGFECLDRSPTTGRCGSPALGSTRSTSSAARGSARRGARSRPPTGWTRCSGWASACCSPSAGTAPRGGARDRRGDPPPRAADT